jgi:hypothetical protein
MSRTLALLFTFFALLPSRALAQTVAPPKWDFSATTGLFSARPGTDSPDHYGERWYSSARGGISVGRYWTPNLKTEVEVMTSGEGMRYASRTATLANGATWSYGAHEYFRASQGSARVVLQLFDNQWVHPYLLAGVAVDADRQRAFIPEQYRYISDGRTPSVRETLVPQQVEGPATVYRVGAMVGAGAKLYFSPTVFANTALLVTHAKPAKTVSIVLGLGIDF